MYIRTKDGRILDFDKLNEVSKLSLDEAKTHSSRLIKEYNNTKIKTKQDLLNKVEKYEEE